MNDVIKVIKAIYLRGVFICCNCVEDELRNMMDSNDVKERTPFFTVKENNRIVFLLRNKKFLFQ